jgi:hypothetical protein
MRRVALGGLFHVRADRPVRPPVMLSRAAAVAPLQVKDVELLTKV